MYVAPFKAVIGLVALIGMVIFAPRRTAGARVAYAAGAPTLGLFVAMELGRICHDVAIKPQLRARQYRYLSDNDWFRPKFAYCVRHPYPQRVPNHRANNRVRVGIGRRFRGR